MLITGFRVCSWKYEAIRCKLRTQFLESAKMSRGPMGPFLTIPPLCNCIQIVIVIEDYIAPLKSEGNPSLCLYIENVENVILCLQQFTRVALSDIFLPSWNST